MARCFQSLHLCLLLEAQGHDQGSTVAVLPDDATIIGWAQELLGF